MSTDRELLVKVRAALRFIDWWADGVQDSAMSTVIDVAKTALADIDAHLKEPEVSDEWENIRVQGFKALMNALHRAESKGYLPDAIREAWEAFDFKGPRAVAANPNTPPQDELAALSDAPPLLTDDEIIACQLRLNGYTQKGFARAIEAEVRKRVGVKT